MTAFPRTIVVLSVALAATVGIGLITNLVLEAQAKTEFEAARAEAVDAVEELADARADLEVLESQAVGVHETSTALLAASVPDFLADPADGEVLASAREQFVTTLQWTVNEDGTINAPSDTDAEVRFVASSDPGERVLRVETARELRAEARTAGENARAVRAEAETVSAATTGLAEANDVLVASAVEKSASLTPPEKASAESVAALTTAVDALGAGVDEPAGLMLGVQQAWTAVLASHDAAVAAEQARRGQDSSGGASIAPTVLRGVLIVNKTYALPSTYGDGLTAATLAAFAAMNAASGGVLSITSGFRSYGTQVSVYNGWVAKEGQAGADRRSARPGHSEHQSGLAFDLNCICEDFATTPGGIFVAEHGHEYGFIVRYPPGKEGVTGYRWEPWHLRYLGVELATALHASGQTLEEYLGVTSVYQ